MTRADLAVFVVAGAVVVFWLFFLAALTWDYPYHVATAAVLLWAFVALHRRLS